MWWNVNVYLFIGRGWLLTDSSPVCRIPVSSSSGVPIHHQTRLLTVWVKHCWGIVSDVKRASAATMITCYEQPPTDCTMHPRYTYRLYQFDSNLLISPGMIQFCLLTKKLQEMPATQNGSFFARRSSSCTKIVYLLVSPFVTLCGPSCSSRV